MSDVYVFKVSEITYPTFPYLPSQAYEELNNLSYFDNDVSEKNEVYEGVREILFRLGFDKVNYNTPNWNPLKGFIKKNQKVLIKPNLVRGTHPNGDEFVKSMITNASLIRPIIDYIVLATEGQVNITIGDVPLQDADWESVIVKSGVKQLCEYYNQKGIEINLVDMRLKHCIVSKEDVVERKINNPDRNRDMYTAVDLGKRSELYEIIHYSEQFEITDYGKGTVTKHHNQDTNEYFLPNEVLEADVFINIPKLKTHRKAGITCAMKNLIGINGDKSWIAHHTRMGKLGKGDEFNQFHLKTFFKVRIWTSLKNYSLGIKIAKIIKKFYIKFIWKGKSYKQISSEGEKLKLFFEGSWHGNDTLWRCIKDLNKIILYSNKSGEMQNIAQRKYLCIVDAVLAGEGEGPMEQKTKKMGVILGGMNAAYIDFVSTRIMKYDYKKIPSVDNAFDNKWWSLVSKEPEEVTVNSNYPFEEIASYFEPTSGWREVLRQMNIEQL